MKIGERVLSNNNLEIVCIPRDDGDIVLKFKPVLDESAFDKLYPRPRPPLITDKDGKRYDFGDKDYIASIGSWAEAKTNWLFLESISATEGLTWETVDATKPETFGNYIQELRASGFTETEQIFMQQAFSKVNTLSSEHLEAARSRFLATTQGTKNQ